MALPSPLPDDPRKWDGWNRYESGDLYERLGLAFEENPSDGIIEENCRQLLVWWQKKLPLKNQLSNPLAQLLRGGMDRAPHLITEARVELLNPESRAKHDLALNVRRRDLALAEFNRFLQFALGKGVLTAEEEKHLYRLGRTSGLTADDMREAIDAGLVQTGAQRLTSLPAAAPAPPIAPLPAPEVSVPIGVAEATATADGAAAEQRAPETRRVRREGRPADPVTEFKRMLRLSGLDSDAMTDDQRDAFINMAENLGLDPGDAEDLVDDYLDEVDNGGVTAAPPAAPANGNHPAAAAAAVRSSPATGAPAKTATNRAPSPRVSVVPATRPLSPGVPLARHTPLIRGGGGTGGASSGAPPAPVEALTPAEERARFTKFDNALGATMFFIPSGAFTMGSDAPGAPANEQPSTRVTLSRFFISRHPVTNAQYEKFDPAHRSKRGAGAGDDHPVIHVSSLEAIKFCQWLSARERRRYRLPTEAEWEYAARGADGRSFPWGESVGRGNLANFADRNTRFAWSDISVDDGWAETSPVGFYPLGASPSGLEDCAGNVWEWCADLYEPYKGAERTNPRGPANGAQRVYRGGSWKSRFASLKTTTRGFNQPAYASSDVGFRVVCETEG